MCYYNTNKDILKEQFEALCAEQEGLYRPEFEAVFSHLNGVSEDKEQRAAALKAAGHEGDSDFCRDFHRYNEIYFEGKKLQYKAIELALEEVKEQEQAERAANEWRFKGINIIAPSEIFPCIDKVIEDGLKENKGLFENHTTTPSEREWEDELLDIEPYEIKGSITAYWEGLKRAGICNPGGLLSEDMCKLLLALLSDDLKYYKSNTPYPTKVKKYITGQMAALDKMPVWGIILQILHLQGLLSWIEGCNLNTGEPGYDEAQTIYNNIVERLIEKEIRFCYMPFGRNDREALKPLCDYLYNTPCGKLVQDELFSDTPCPESMEAQFEKAIDAGYIEKTSTGLKWKGTAAQLGYLCLSLYGEDYNTPWAELEALFEVKKLRQSAIQVMDAKRPQKWRKEIEELASPDNAK